MDTIEWCEHSTIGEFTCGEWTGYATRESFAPERWRGNEHLTGVGEAIAMFPGGPTSIIRQNGAYCTAIDLR